MKRIVSVILAFAMLLSLSACSGGGQSLTPEPVDKKVEAGEIGTIQASYSVKNSKD